MERDALVLQNIFLIVEIKMHSLEKMNKVRLETQHLSFCAFQAKPYKGASEIPLRLDNKRQLKKCWAVVFTQSSDIEMSLVTMVLGGVISTYNT